MDGRKGLLVQNAVVRPKCLDESFSVIAIRGRHPPQLLPQHGQAAVRV